MWWCTKIDKYEVWVQPTKISVPSSDNVGSMESIKGTFLCVLTRELVGMQAECVAAYVRLTRLPHRDHSPYQLHSHLSSECTFSGSAVRNALCLLNRLLPSPIVTVNKPLADSPHDPSSPVTTYFAFFWRDSKLFLKDYITTIPIQFQGYYFDVKIKRE